MGEMNSVFAVNLCILVTFAYLANLLYKYVFVITSSKVKYVASVLLIIFSGWVSMNFGLNLGDNVLFDLRFVPLVIAALSYSEPVTLIIIGTGIGLSRLSFGINDAALAGCYNLIILGVLAALLNLWMKRCKLRFIWRALIIIVVINIVNTLDIAVLGVIPFREYMGSMMPKTFPVMLVLSAGFSFMFRDFQLERRQSRELGEANLLMQRQTEELHKAKMVLEERAHQLMLASHYKSEFLANMSHELRTPLNSIINLAQLIKESESHSAQDQEEEVLLYAGIIHKSGQELLQLINDILDLSKVEAGRLEVVYEEVSLCEIPELLYLHFEHVAVQKGLQFKIIRDEVLPGSIFTDGQRIQQILRNLLSNAFKFTEQGSVTLNIRGSGKRDQTIGEWLVFEVKDTGIGIAKDKHSSIFEAFRQADGTISRTYGGTGLGLSISRDLARLLGGFIRVESEVGIGSTFSLYLPSKWYNME